MLFLKTFAIYMTQWLQLVMRGKDGSRVISQGNMTNILEQKTSLSTCKVTQVTSYGSQHNT